MENQNIENVTFTKLKKLHRLHYPLTPYQLFSPVSSVFLNNLTQEEQILGIYKKYNELIVQFNSLTEAVNEIQDAVNDLIDEVNELSNAFDSLRNYVVTELTNMGNQINALNNQLVNLSLQISAGDEATLAAAKKYTDEEIAKIQPGGGSSAGQGGFKCGALTAAQYDAWQIAAVDYDDLKWTAFIYDNYAKYELYGSDGTVYLDFKNEVTVGDLQTVFDLSNPPVQLNKRYLVEISLGNFSLDGNEPAHLEIVGQNTLGNTLPITVPSGGSATVAVVWTALPTAVRGMSGQASVTGYNAYIKIKPLGEK